MTPNRTILLVLLLALFSACRKDFDDTVKVTEITPDPTVKVESTIYGVVVDDSDEPLPFTIITLGNDEAITDKQGVFIMKNIYAPQYLGVLHVHHLNYTPEYHIINAFVGDTLRLFLHLSKERILGTIQPNTVKTTIKEELLHLFPDRVSYKDELQNEYTKTVYLRGRVVNRIKSIQQNTHSIAVKGNSKGILQQFALFEMYYRKESGFDLLYSNKNIPAQWDIIPELQTIAPTQLTVWHYDESTDLWRKSGEAKKVGTTYRFEVKESGKYCLASFSSMKYFSGTIKTSKGGNASFVPLSVKYGAFENTQHISTTHKGKFTVFLPENTSFSFNGYKLCGDVILSKTFSTTTQNTLLESPITLDDEENVHRFKGVLLDCDNNKLLNGYVSVSGEQWSNQIYLSNSDGKFAGTLETCKDEKIIIEGFDPNKSSSGLPISLYLNSRVSEGLVTSCKEDIESKAYVIVGNHRFDFSSCTLNKDIFGKNIISAFSFEAKNDILSINHLYLKRKVSNVSKPIWSVKDNTSASFGYQVVSLVTPPLIKKTNQIDGKEWIEFEISDVTLKDVQDGREIQHCRLYYFAPLQ